MIQHKWHKEIKAWADGAEIEHKHSYQDNWRPVSTPNWSQSLEFRIKPQPKEPKYLYVYADSASWSDIRVGIKDAIKPYERYIGKIKLEEEC